MFSGTRPSLFLLYCMWSTPPQSSFPRRRSTFHKRIQLLLLLLEPPRDKTNNVAVRPAKTQISLGIRLVWSESSLCAQWVAKGPSFLHADSEDSDQTGRMPRLIWVFAGRTLTLLVLSRGGSLVKEYYWVTSTLYVCVRRKVEILEKGNKCRNDISFQWGLSRKKKNCNFLNLQEFHLSVKDIDMIKMLEIVVKCRSYGDMTFLTRKHFLTLYRFLTFSQYISLHLPKTRIFQVFKICFRIVLSW